MTDALSRARLIAASHCPVTPRMLASACAVGLGLGVISANAATFTVNDVGDPGDGACDATCTLRDAVTAANLTTATDTIKFSTTTFPLTASTTITLSGAEPHIEINNSLIITGPGPGVITINGGFDDRIFYIDGPTPSTISVNISGLRLEDGDDGDGGAIYNSSGKLTISNCIFDNNIASDDGGAIATDGSYSTLTIKDSVFTGNTASDKGGALYIDNTSQVTARAVHISNTRVISSNTAEDGGGIYLDSVDAPVLIENSVIDGNYANLYSGAGIGIDSTGTRGSITIRNSTISNNVAVDDGGGVWMDDPSNPVLIDNSTISDNNSADDGGGIYVDDPSNVVRLRNTTVADNYANDDGGGIYLYGSSAYEEEQALILQNTIVADNYAPGGADDLREYYGRFLAEFTIVGDTSGAGTIQNLRGQGTDGDNILDVAPDIDSLANNGSGRETHAPDFMSLAIDAGNSNLCTAAAGATSAATVFDGRGVFRPVDGDLDLVKACDIGAVEFNGRSFGDCPSSPDLTSCTFDTGDGNGFTVGTLTIKDNLTNNTLDSMTLSLTKNAALIGQEFFGAPTALDGTANALCIYFDGTLVAQYNAQAGDPASTGIARWKQVVSTTANTNTYTNSTGNADGLTKLAQKSGAINAASILAAAKGAAMPDVTLPAVGAVVVEQYTSDGDRCISTTLSNVTVNTNTTLTAKIP